MIMKMNTILHDYSLYDKKINQIPPLEMSEMVLFSLNHLFINRSLFDLVNKSVYDCYLGEREKISLLVELYS